MILTSDYAKWEELFLDAAEVLAAVEKKDARGVASFPSSLFAACSFPYGGRICSLQVTGLEERVISLERELRKVKTELQSVKKASQKPWWDHVAGRFKNDPLFDETIKAGQKYRRSLKPRT